MVFDTLKFVKSLKAAGISEQHAEAEADRLDQRLTAKVNRLDGKIMLGHWMVGFNLTLSVAILLRLLMSP